MGFLSGLFESKANSKNNAGYLPGDPASINRALGSASGVYAGYKQGLPAAGSWDGLAATKHGYERVIWIFRAVDVIASNQASITITLRKGFDRRMSPVVDNDRLWKLLNFRTNTYESSWMFRYRLSSQLLLSRRGAFIEIVKGRDGLPAELHLLPVGKTEPIPDTRTFVSGYEVTRADYTVDKLDPDQVIWVRTKPHPVDPYQQMTPLLAAGIEADTDYLARMFNRNFLAKDGRPGMLITVDPGESNMLPEDAELLKSRFNGGPTQAGDTTVIEGRGVSAQDLSASPRDLQWDQLLATSKERLLMAFGVPESIMGNASGRTFDNANAERVNFWLDTEMNHCDSIAFALDPLTGSLTDDLIFGYEYDEVDVLQEVAANRREEWRGEQNSGLRTIDEYLKAAGENEWNRPETRLLYLPNGLIVGKDDADQKTADKLMEKLQAQQQAAPPGGAGGTPDAVAGAMKGLQKAQAKWGNDIAARAMAIGQKSQPRTRSIHSRKPKQIEAKSADDKERKSLEDFVLGVLTAWDDRQLNVIPERITHAKARKGTRHWDGATQYTKALDPDYVFDTDQWATDLKTTLRKQITATVKRTIRSSVAEIQGNGVLGDMIDAGDVTGTGIGLRKLYSNPNDADKQQQKIVDDAMGVVDAAIANQAKRIKDRIKKLDAEGQSAEQIRKAVRKELTNNRTAWRNTLAANMATNAVEASKKAVADRTGGRMVGVWIAHHDERTRPTHLAANGSLPDADGKYQVGDARLSRPGDPTGPAHEVINCRCHLLYAKGPIKGVKP